MSFRSFLVPLFRTMRKVLHCRRSGRGRLGGSTVLSTVLIVRRGVGRHHDGAATERALQFHAGAIQIHHENVAAVSAVKLDVAFGQ